jgi:hypothetical protein
MSWRRRGIGSLRAPRIGNVQGRRKEDDRVFEDKPCFQDIGRWFQDCDRLFQDSDRGFQDNDNGFQDIGRRFQKLRPSVSGNRLFVE